MKEIKEKIEVAIRNAGAIILSAGQIEDGVEKKEGHANFVTKYDKMVQDYLEKELLSILPEAVFVGEEEDVHAAIQTGYAYIVDPIDGTTNFMKGYHMSAVSIALLKDGEPVLGMVYNPYLDELFCAEKGKGAYCNEKLLQVSDKPLEESIVIVGTAPYRTELADSTFAAMRWYFDHSLDIRRSGSAALDLCAIAAGRAELFFEMILSPWDYAAAALIVKEAGGTVSGISGNALQYETPMGVVACSKQTGSRFPECFGRS